MKQFSQRSRISLLGLLILFSLPSLSKEPDSTLLEWVGTAQNFKEQGKYDSAIVFIEKALTELDPFKEGDWLGLQLLNERAALYGANGSFSQAEIFLQELRGFLQQVGGRDSLYAEVLHGIGTQKYNLGEYAEARRYLDEALVLKKQLHTELHPTVANTYNSLGNLVSDEGHLEQARAYYEKALTIRKQVLPEDHPHISDTYQNLGILEYMEEDYESAIQLIKYGFEIEKRIYPPDHPLIASTYNNLGVMYDVMGNTSRALEYYQASLKIRRKILGEKHPAVAQSYHNLGVVYQEYGDFRKALANMFQSLHIFREVFGNEKNEEVAANLETIGSIYLYLDEFQNAEKYIQQALGIFIEIFPPGHPDIGRMLHSLGEVERELGNYQRAHSYFDKAKAIYTNKSRNSSSLARLYKDEAMLCMAEGRFEEAISAFEQGDHIYVQLYGTTQQDRTVLLNEMAEAYFLQNHIKAAKRTYQEAIRANLPDFSWKDINQLPSIRSAPINIPFYIRSLHRKANIHAKEGSAEEWKIAIELWEIALHWLGKMQSQSTYRASKLDFRSRARDMCEASVKTHIKLYEASQEESYLEAAYQLAEYSQTALLHEWMQELEARQQAGVPGELIEKVQDFTATISYYEKKLYDTRGKTTTDSLEFLRYRTRLFEVRNSLDSLIAAIEVQFPTYFEVKYQKEALDLREIQQNLSPGEQVVRYFLTRDKLFMFSLRKNELTLQSRDIDSTFFQTELQFYEFLQKNPSETLQKEEEVKFYLTAGYQLYEQVLRPIVHEQTHKLYLIPDGVLNYLSFEALLSEPVWEFLSFSDLPYVLTSYEISYAYSTRMLFSPESQMISPSFLGFAPEYGKELFNNASTRFVDSSDIDRLPPLVYNQSEVESLQTLMRGQAYLGEDAREEIFKQEAPQAGILHLAMHAIADDLNPLYSGLAFSQVDSLFDDNFLYTYELFNMHLKANLAVLSACNTGIGEIQRGEGMLSLATGFQYAGCPNLVMSLWQTDDKVAYQLMQAFYTNLKGGNAYSEALHKAKMDYLNTQDRTHPFYWATFQYVGQDAGFSHSFSFWWIVLTLGILSLLRIVFKKRKS